MLFRYSPTLEMPIIGKRRRHLSRRVVVVLVVFCNAVTGC